MMMISLGRTVAALGIVGCSCSLDRPGRSQRMGLSPLLRFFYRASLTQVTSEDESVREQRFVC